MQSRPQIFWGLGSLISPHSTKQGTPALGLVVVGRDGNEEFFLGFCRG